MIQRKKLIRYKTPNLPPWARRCIRKNKTGTAKTNRRQGPHYFFDIKKT